MRISFFSSDGTLNKVDRSHTIFGIEREEPSRFFFFFFGFPCLAYMGGVWLDGLGVGGISLPEGFS